MRHSRTTDAVLTAARARPKRPNRGPRPRPDLRHPDYDKRLQLIATRRSEGATFRQIAKEIGLCYQRVQALAQLLPSSSRSEKKTP